MQEVLCLRIEFDEFLEVHGHKGRVRMICFHGEVDSQLFQGKVMPGGVDTQIREMGEVNRVSARYILEGRDYTGDSCRIFIENNGMDPENGDSIQTRPRIITDSIALSWLENADLYGTVSEQQGILYARIYCKKKI